MAQASYEDIVSASLDRVQEVFSESQQDFLKKRTVKRVGTFIHVDFIQSGWGFAVTPDECNIYDPSELDKAIKQQLDIAVKGMPDTV